ncbi:hypothetical protein NA56DRAFT_340010 [Hyaloscypha hepaticicola]|uniref:C2H2-type domain-containing protein n=1 Tax=Hyaloscypha hepaticicola TaxID=2082293 RepID=A0A2J6QIV2_9HELO|nr:hypothetical protein NA56DRAFT_340010 [Hyaloscypha hepaticicola]
MSFYPSSYPADLGHDSTVSIFGDVFNDSGELTYEGSFSREETHSSLTTSTTGNHGEVVASHLNSSQVEMPAAESFVLQSQGISSSFACFPLHAEGELNENENWDDDFDEFSEGVSMTTTTSPFTTQQLGIGQGSLDCTSYENIHDYAMTSLPLHFAATNPPMLTHSTHHVTTPENKTYCWASQSMNQASSPGFPQGLCETQSSTHTAISSNTTASAATQTEDSLQMEDKLPIQFKTPTRNTTRRSRYNFNRQGSGGFPCAIDGCNRSYNRKFELLRHQKTHLGVKEHHCRFTTCMWAAPNGFTRKDHLKQHLRQVHKTSA